MKKFVLTENIKHILNEKYLLDERYILTEASMITVIAKNGQQIADTIPALKEKLEQIKEKFTLDTDTDDLAELSEIKDKVDAIDKAAKEVENSKKISGASEELKADLNSYHVAVEAFDKLFTKSKLTDELTKLKTAISTDDWTDKTQADALVAYDALAKAFAVIKAKVDEKSASYDSEMKLDTRQKIIALCDETAKRLDTLQEKYLIQTDIDINDDELLDSYNDLLQGTIQPAFEALLKFDLEAKTKISELTKILKDVSEAISKLATVADPIANKIASAEVQSGREKTREKDWETLYKNCNSAEAFAKFWEDYYKTEWGEKAGAVKNLGKVFVDDLVKVGWDTKSNPILKLLKTTKIYNLLGETFTRVAYTAIHNALARNYLNPKDLEASDSSTFGASNIIFNTNLYKSVDDIDSYLYNQSRLRASQSSLKDTAKLVWALGQDGRSKVLNNLMLEAGNLSDYSTNTRPGSELRPISDIKAAMVDLIGEDGGEKEIATNTTISEILKLVKNPDDAKQRLAFLYMRWLGEHQKEFNAVDNNRPFMADILAGYIANASAFKIIASKAEEYDKQMLKYEYTTDLIKKLLDGLATAAEFKSKKEKP